MEYTENLILETPEIPTGVRDAINKNNLAIFIGAGVSRLLGCKDWHTLAEDLMKVCYEEHCLNFNEYDILSKETDNKKLISISFQLLEKNNKIKLFYKKLRKSLKSSKEKIKNNCIFEKIRKMGTMFITTNADICFDNVWGKDSPNIVYDFSKNIQPENYRLYHIHGSISHPKSLVFTAEQYLRRYQNDNFKKFLRELFEKYVVLFIGYGLSEFELLDFLMLKSEESNHKQAPKHFVLMPYFSYERKIAEYYNLYFQNLNIQTIPFAKDTNGFDQLFNIIDAWEKQIHDTTFLVTNTIGDLEKIIQSKNFNKINIDKIFKLIESNVVFNKFIELCGKYTYTTNVFIESLYDRGYFSPEKNIAPIELKESSGRYRVPDWNMMEFLKAYLEYVKETDNKENFDLFKKIVLENIENISSSRIDNFRTDASLVEFIFSFDEEDITNDCIKFLKYALQTKWNKYLISDIAEKKIFPRLIDFNDTNKITKIISILFSFDYIDKYKIQSLIESFFLKKIIEEFFVKLYEKIGLKLVNIFETLISRLKPELLIFTKFDASKKSFPEVDDTNYPQTLVNCYLWLVLQQSDSQNFLQQRNHKENKTLKFVIESMLNNFDSNGKYSTKSTDIYYTSDFYEVDAQSDDIVLDSVQNIINFIETCSNTNISLIESIARKLHNAVLENPNLLINNLDKFINVPFVYIHQILSAYVSIIREEKKIDSKPILPFINNIIQRSELWKNKQGAKAFNYKLWTINDISEFVSQYCLRHQNISISDYMLLNSFITKIYENLNEDKKQIQGYMSYMLNSENGKCSEALLHLYFSALSNTYEDIAQKIQNIFRKELHLKKKQTLFTALSVYYAGIYYKNKDFAISIYSELFNLKDKFIRDAVLEGYLYTPYTTMSKDYYLFLTENKFFDEIIEYVVNNEQWCAFIARIACAVYLEDVEKLENPDSLLVKIIGTNHINYIGAITSYFFNIRKKNFSDDKIIKIEKIWTKICEQLKPYENNSEYNEYIVDLLEFVSLMPIIDEQIMKNIEFSIRWIYPGRIEYYLLDDLLRLYDSEENQKYVETIIELFAEKEIFFYDYNEKLTSLFTKIYENNKDKAIMLCNLYIQGGNSKYMELLNKLRKEDST